ncbi:MAG: hypothetical protein D6798_02005 [Deltaproteobacteria bacterium]|nr:MAG: hypothetical protein D6798_02005 [Deltaproteobacteria bacterium]
MVVVRSPLRPDAGCLGGRLEARLFVDLWSSLEDVGSLDHLPATFGPHVTLGERRELPAGVDKPAEWVKRFVLPSVARADRATGEVRAPRRASYGYSFFKQQKVARWVKKTFNPTSDLVGWLGEEAGALAQVTHWVPGKDEVLLMEPIVPRRNRLEHDLQEVATRFSAYRWALERARRDDLAGSLVAYVLSGGDAARRAHIIDKLEPVAHQVVDIHDDEEKKDFIAKVERTGRSGAANELPF